MKQLLFATLLASSSFIGTIAQTTSNLVIFAEDPKPFYAIVNGIKQNAEPQTNVKITDLTNPNTSIKIVFSDGTPDLNKTIWFEVMGKEVTLRIVNTKKGYKLRYFGEVNIANSVNNDSQSVIVYQTVDAQPTIVNTPTDQTVTVTEQVVTTTNTNSTMPVSTTTTVPITTENINLGMDIGGFGVNVNVTESGTSGTTTTNTNSNADFSSTTTTTTTTTTSTSGFDYGTSDVEIVEATPVQYVNGYTGYVGCPMPVSSVKSIKSAIEDESFSDDKMNIAKQAVKNRCLTVEQVRELMSVFDFEDKKIEFAKYAYNRTYDIENYYLVNKDFDFSSTKEELNKYLETK